MPPDTPPRYGKKQIQAGAQPEFDLVNSKMDIDLEEVRILGNQAYSHGSYSSKVTPKEGGTTTEIRGTFLTILEKQADGFWKILIDCFNVTTQPVGGGPALPLPG